jgi:protein MNN4
VAPDKKDQVNGVVPPQAETQTAQGKNQRELERQKQLAAEKAEKAKKEAEKKAKELAEQEKKAAEKRKQEEEKKKKLQEENEKKEEEKKAKQESANKQQNKPSEKKETATASKEFTRDSKFEDLATLSGDASNLKFEFNKGVLQTDGNGKYILINGEKYYEYTDDESKQNPALKYFDLNRNHPKGIEIQF